VRAFTKKDIIAILCCIIFLIAGFGAVGESGRRRAREIVCLSNLHQWGNIYDRYTNDHDGYLTGGTHYNPPNGPRGIWFLVFQSYYGNNLNLLFCPQASIPAEGEWDSGIFRAWEANYRGEVYTGSYGENSWACAHEPSSISRPDRFYWKNIVGIQGRNNIPVLADATHFDAWPKHYDDPPEFPDDVGSGNVNIPNMQHFCIDRHNGGINMLFMDWSARKVGLKELWTLKWHREWELGPDGEYDPSPWTIAGGVQPEDWPEWMRNFKDF